MEESNIAKNEWKDHEKRYDYYHITILFQRFKDNIMLLEILKKMIGYGLWKDHHEWVLKHLIDVIKENKESGKKAKLLSIAGELNQKQGKYQEALDFYKSALEMNVKLFGKENHEVGNNYVEIGGMYESQGNNKETLEKALENYKLGFEIYFKYFGTSHEKTMAIETKIKNIEKEMSSGAEETI